MDSFSRTNNPLSHHPQREPDEHFTGINVYQWQYAPFIKPMRDTVKPHQIQQIPAAMSLSPPCSASPQVTTVAFALNAAKEKLVVTTEITSLNSS